jgi:hypothetical protein
MTGKQTTHSRKQRQHEQPATDDRDKADLDTYIKDLVDAAPPLTPEQRDKLSLLLNIRHRS